ncbi:methyltransferase domain-containing protein, partial [candidate division WOR-3 bacterium]|nr:methyltransferase domain-containing protein [candidate division WOR-3 bacterium]
METDTERWLKKYGKEFLRDIGIREGQTVLDFGCGSGYYTIPAAKIVGSNGKVYALDKDGEKLKEVAEMAASENLSN